MQMASRPFKFQPAHLAHSLSKAGNPPNAAARFLMANPGVINSDKAAEVTERAMRFRLPCIPVPVPKKPAPKRSRPRKAVSVNTKVKATPTKRIATVKAPAKKVAARSSKPRAVKAVSK